LYCIAIEKNISNKAARRFKIELTLFNSYYRVAKRLLIVAQNIRFVENNDNNADNNNNTENEKNKNKINNKIKNKII